MSALSTLLVILAVACLLLMVILLSVATRHAREVRSSIFPIVREEGAARVRRARLSATIAAVVAAVAAVAFAISGPAAFPVLLPSMPEMPLLSYLSPTDTFVVEPTASHTPRPVPSPTQVAPTLTPTVSPAEASPTATSTQTNTPTALPATDTPVAATPTAPTATMPAPEAPSPAVTPSATPPSTTVSVTEAASAGETPSPTAGATLSPTPVASPLPAPAGAQLGPITFALEVDDRRMAVTPAQVFSETVNRVYAVFPFSGMQKGLTWTQVWFINGSEFAREQSAWQWGSQSYSYIFVKPVGAGEYRLDLYVNDQLLTSGKFTILGPTAIGGPATP